MKKLFLICACILLLCGCSLTTLPDDACDFLIEADWEGKDAQCINVISFKEDGSFSNWCYCGSPVGAGDVVEEFRYRASDQTIHLLNDRNQVMEIGTIQYMDDMYLILDLWERCYVYENINTKRPSPRSCALTYTGTEEISKPYLHILDYENGVLTVSSYDYDGDTAANFDIWTLPAHKDITFSDVCVTVENETETLEVSQLTEKDYQYIGEFYTTGYVEMNYEGEVASVIFYGETIMEYSDALQYQGKTYVNLEYPMNIFTYYFYTDQYFEEDIIYPIPHERWDMISFGGDLFVYEAQLEEAIAYYADDENYDWFVVFDEEDTERSCSLSLTTEELNYLYEMDAMDFTLTETMSFDDIIQFASIQKRSKDHTVYALISLAYCRDSWYWKTEIMEDDPESNKEYMVILPDSLNEKLFTEYK